VNFYLPRLFPTENVRFLPHHDWRRHDASSCWVHMIDDFSHR